VEERFVYFEGETKEKFYCSILDSWYDEQWHPYFRKYKNERDAQAAVSQLNKANRERWRKGYHEYRVKKDTND
jgi:hypothetical protein